MTLKPETKICSKCGEEKLLKEFNLQISGKYGRYSWCKICASDLNKKYRKQNRDKILEYGKEYHKQNQDKRNLESKEYYKQNRDKILKYRKEYREQNQDKRKEYYKQNQDKRKEYYKQNRDKLEDNYIKNSLSNISGIKFKDISPELIEAKREQIKLYRLIKKIKNELRSKTKECVTSKCKHKNGLSYSKHEMEPLSSR